MIFAETYLLFCRRKQQDWFADNDHEIKSLLYEYHRAYNLLLNASGSPNRERNLYKQIKSETQRKLRAMQDKWWKQKAEEIQVASDCNNTKLLYKLLREAYGPRVSTVVLMRSKSGNELFRNPTDILGRWREYFNELLNQPSQFDYDFVRAMPTYPVKLSMADLPTFQEVVKAIKMLNCGKSPGMDGIYAEILKCGGNRFLERLHDLFKIIWMDVIVPQDWKDAVILILYKGKGPKDVCGNSRGIAMLSVIGKAFSRIMLDRLLLIVNEVLTESQYGFRTGRSTVDMIFSARQLQEKCVEQ